MALALPGVSSSTPPAYSRAGGFLRVVSPAELDDREKARLAALSAQNRPTRDPQVDLGAYVRQRWMAFRNHRNHGNNSLNGRLLRAQRMFEGKYDPDKLVEIKKFGGSEVYSRLVAVKCRGATSLLRDVYLGAERPWTIDSQPDPPVPPEVKAAILQLLTVELATQEQAGQAVMPDQAHMRLIGLMHAAQQAARRNAMVQADAASDKIEDILEAGNFYGAFAEFLTDLPLFPFAVLKGPVVKMVPALSWVNGRPMMRNLPRMFWERISPFDFYFSPGVADIEHAEIIERKRLTRTDLNDLLNLPGYDQTAVRLALQDYENGLRDWLDYPDTEQALNEARENPYFNQSHVIDAIEYHGNIQGRMLLQNGADPQAVPDLDRDYTVQTWVVGQHVLKTQINPSPRQRVPYYVTSFEKVPGTIFGHGLPDILEDMQEIANASLRALVNNMAIASGPQVVVNTEVLHPTTNEDDLYPWKRWKVTSDPMGNNRDPVTFFQPQSNSNELLMVYSAISGLADDISAIPRYVTGESLKGGAGRTSSGLAMLMNNSSKVLQTVASNVDGDVLKPALHGIYDMIMLTDTSGMLTGDEQIRVNGVTVAIQKETERQKQLQALQITANPIDMDIMGEDGRAKLLRAVLSGKNLGLPDDIIPDDNTIAQRIQAKQAMAAAAPNPEGELTKAKIENQRALALAALAKSGLIPQALPTGNLTELDQIGPNAPGGQDGTAPSPASRAQGSQAPTPTPARLSDHAPAFNTFRQGPNQGAPTNGP